VIPVPVVDFDAERSFDEDRFEPQVLFETDRTRVVCGCFEPGQFVPVHAPGSDVVVDVRRGTGAVREGETTHHVGAGDVVVVEADTKRGVRADEDARLEALLVASPPPSEAEHERVQRGIERGGFTPSGGEP